MDQLFLDRRSFLRGAAALGVGGALASVITPATRYALADGESGPAIVIGRPVDSDDLGTVTCIGNVNIFVFNLILEGLVKTSDDGSSVEPDLAESWDISDDGKTYTFHVKSGLKFSDGTDVTAQDWQWTFDRAMQYTDGNWYSTVENIDKVETPDDTTVVITLKQAAASALANLSIFMLGVQSKAYYDKVGADEYKNGPLGTGPFKVKSWEKGVSLILEKNTGYRDAGKPLASTVEFRVVADDDSRTLQLQSGDLDIATDVPFVTMQQLESDANCQAHPDPSTMVYWVSLNTTNEHLKDPNVRKALYLATDAKQIADAVTYGYGNPVGSIMAPTSQYCDTDIPAPAADLDQAKQLLSDAGLGGGFDLTLLLRSGNAQYEEIAMLLQAQWSKVGVNVTLDQRESTAYSDARKKGEMDLIISGWSDDIQDPTQLMQFVFDYSVTSGYYSFYQQPDDMLKLNSEATVETDVEKRKDLYRQIQEGLRDQYIFIPLYTTPWQNAIRRNVSGFVQTPLGNYRFADLTK